MKRWSPVLLIATALVVIAAPLSAAELTAELTAPGCSGVPALASGARSSDNAALDTAEAFTIKPIGVPCGGITCAPGLECCNPTCNTCVLPGMSCTQQVCNSTEDASQREPQANPTPIGPIEPQPCGNAVCGAGTYCCNPLCSACVPLGQYCTLGSCGGGPTS